MFRICHNSLPDDFLPEEHFRDIIDTLKSLNKAKNQKKLNSINIFKELSFLLHSFESLKGTTPYF